MSHLEQALLCSTTAVIFAAMLSLNHRHRRHEHKVSLLVNDVNTPCASGLYNPEALL